MATSREMTSGRPFPLILNFAFPLLLGNLLQQTYSLMDAALVGKFLGINALASVGAVSYTHLRAAAIFMSLVLSNVFSIKLCKVVSV